MTKTECSVCGKNIEVTDDEIRIYTEPLCEEHEEEEEVYHE